MPLTINDCLLNYMVGNIIINQIITSIIIILRSFIWYFFKWAANTPVPFHNLNILRVFSVKKKKYIIHWVHGKNMFDQYIFVSCDKFTSFVNNKLFKK